MSPSGTRRLSTLMSIAGISATTCWSWQYGTNPGHQRRTARSWERYHSLTRTQAPACARARTHTHTHTHTQGGSGFDVFYQNYYESNFHNLNIDRKAFNKLDRTHTHKVAFGSMSLTHTHTHTRAHVCVCACVCAPKTRTVLPLWSYVFHLKENFF